MRGKNRYYDPFGGEFLDSPIINLPSDNKYQGVSASWTSVMLPLLHQEGFRARVLLMGEETAQRIDLGVNNPSWTPTKKRDWTGTPPNRSFVCPVILPNGNIFFAGGTQQDGNDQVRDANAVLDGEIYDPNIDWDDRQHERGFAACSHLPG